MLTIVAVVIVALVATGWLIVVIGLAQTSVLGAIGLVVGTAVFVALVLWLLRNRRYASRPPRRDAESP